MACGSGENPLCFSGFKDPSRRKHTYMLDSECSHSNKEKVVRAKSGISGAGTVDRSLPSIQALTVLSSCSQTLRNLESNCDGP